jgi:hypothetical protein
VPRVRLSTAQISALECRPVQPGEALEPEDQVIARAVEAGAGLALVFEDSEREALFSALVEASNAEDAFASFGSNDGDQRKAAGRAARSLAALSGRVLRAGLKVEAPGADTPPG